MLFHCSTAAYVVRVMRGTLCMASGFAGRFRGSNPWVAERVCCAHTRFPVKIVSTYYYYYYYAAYVALLSRGSRTGAYGALPCLFGYGFGYIAVGFFSTGSSDYHVSLDYYGLIHCSKNITTVASTALISANLARGP